MKKKIGFYTAFAAIFPLNALADITLYGKANVSLESVDEGEKSIIALESNASRLGFKGAETISDGLDVIYQMEYETNFDDNAGNPFRQRNIFVGLKGGFGQIIGGHFDTPLKNAQNKVDLFNDLRGDIKNFITPNDNRENNSVMYSSPSWNGFAANLAYIASEAEEVDDGKSLSLTYTTNGLYVALAFDQDVEAENAEALRAVVQYTISLLQLGFLYEQYEEDGADSEDAWVVSALYNFNDRWALKGQYGQSSIAFGYSSGLVTDDNESISVGVDYKINKNVLAYGFYTSISAENGSVEVVDNDYFGLGLELRF
ncbi:porin [Saccharophagus sp. K07]|uniref:porin n=1 Tax=Saccharophagus sp. K07 TaxID=2283636 RepID=UPI001651CCC2|nr:porin [Saccharophagus sp. K07]MBC6906879.1 porin [Saccharophagus sp. K07]